MSFHIEEIMKNIIGVDELRDFPKVEKRLETIKEGFIFQNNRPTHVIITLDEYEKWKAQKEIPEQTEDSSDGLDVLLNKVGKKVFVDYYNVFKTNNNPEEALETEGFTLASRRSRSSSARTIFKNNMQIAALENIAASDRIDTEIVEEAKKLLCIEKEGVVFDTDSDEMEDSFHIKIGKMMKGIIMKLIQSGSMSEDELLKLQDSEYSKRVINLNFPVLKVVEAGDTVDNSKRDAKGYNRYYDTVVIYGGKQYLICSQWVDNLHKDSVKDWIVEKMINILVSIVEKMPHGEAFEVKDMLPDYWPYINHVVRNSIGRGFKSKMTESGLATLGEKKGNRQTYIKA